MTGESFLGGVTHDYDTGIVRYNTYVGYNISDYNDYIYIILYKFVNNYNTQGCALQGFQ